MNAKERKDPMVKNKIKYVYIALALISAMVLSAIPTGATEESASVILGGMPFGVSFSTDQLKISGFDDISTSEGKRSPAKEAGLMENDIIVSLNGKKVNCALDITLAVRKSEGASLEFGVLRGKEELKFKVTPVLSEEKGCMCLGILLEDSSAGLGTVTYIDPETGEFAGLGHGITDSKENKLLKIEKGIVSQVQIADVNRGEKGSPGELCGDFSTTKLGLITKNTPAGVFGIMTSFPSDCPEKEIELGKGAEAKNGGASIYCTVGGGIAEEYAVEISILDKNSSEEKNFIVTVTDRDLIEKTGGIVRGMSGSPIVQDGKLIGAVTHVLVNDPTRGYGIFIENMQSAAK